MWLLKDTPGLFMDLYELTMAQAYYKNDMNEKAFFEVTVRDLPQNWGFFIMAGLAEIDSYLKQFKFVRRDIEFLKSIEMFSTDFLQYLEDLRPQVQIRCLPEGTIFFPNEPVLEVGGPLIHAQILESYMLNILGFSIIEATLAARISIAARGRGLVDFGLRRSQGPIAAARSARAAKIANFAGTSNLFASKLLDFQPAGTMAHSYIEAHGSEERAFRQFIDLYDEKAILLVDTYDAVEGIKKAAKVAHQVYEEKNIRIRGIRIDSGDFISLSKFARQYFKEKRVDFLKIFVSSGLDEYRIAELLNNGAEIDGFGIGTRFAVSHQAPDIDIVYKIVQYAGKGLYKTSPDKQTKPKRKTIVRTQNKFYVKDSVHLFKARADDLLKFFESPEPLDKLRKRLSVELANLPDSIKAITNPQKYPVEFVC
jgi:nicotinate phosphoribosyltransferase